MGKTVISTTATTFDRLKSWSYSVYTQWVKCPRSVCYAKILKVDMKEDNPKFERGDAMHAAAQTYTTAKTAPTLLPRQDLFKFKPQLDRLRKYKTKLVEQDWSFTRQWKRTRYDDWKNCWLRIKVDFCGVVEQLRNKPGSVEIIDYKSGKVYEDHKQQRSLYALGGLQLVQIGELKAGKAAEVTAAHYYTDTGMTATQEFAMDELPDLMKEWEARVAPMMSDTRYQIQEGHHCKWCRFRKSNGGPCPANK